ncbi:uncharacterized protein Tco025E_00823 [Trypanosoma conorhini]|uniref:Cyclic nucleotide-binding domain-containing protein n=1 Tax=Trypanosoma conorhini TaxID=83891 RepID=A0A422QAI2_9TRYP|nr:uncharacterized protein Tco025E_00823 [Trypanosoma conorhini]RNF26957.1 hypothetical protein Tco025E_00823 [Trypanosoma conorhini]
MPLSPVVEARLRLRLGVVRRHLAQRRVIPVVPRLGVEKLRSCPFFAKWPAAALSELRREMVLEVYLRGEALLYGGVPCAVSSLFWIVSGTLAELPSRRDRCERKRLLETVEGSVPLVSNVWGKAPSCGSSHAEFHDNLATFGAGQFAAGERLFVGLPYHRTIHCESNVTCLTVSFRAVQRLRKKWQVPPEASESAAKEIMREQLLRADDRPPLPLALQQNPILCCLDAATLSILWIRLSPMVACANEVICDDVFTADTVSFLLSGEVRVGGTRDQRSSKIVPCGGAVGLQSFAPYEVPRAGDEKCPAVALTFSQLWGIGRQAFSEMVSDTEWRKCAAVAQKTIHFKIDPALLEGVRVFASLSLAKVAALAKRMELRVVRGAAYILSPNKKPQEAIVVLVGRVYFEEQTSAERAPHGGKAARTHIPCGTPVAFAECVAEVPLRCGVFAETGAVVVSLTRRAMVETFRRNDNGPEMEPAVTEAAMTQLDVPLAARNAARIVNKAQERAVQRVRKHALVQPSSAAPREEEQQGVSLLDLDVDRMIELRTQVLSTLALQVRSLRPGMWQAERGGAHYDTASRTIMRNAAPNEAPKPHRRQSCFSLDERGCLVFCGKGAVVDEKPEGGAQPPGSLSGAEGEEYAPRRASPIHLAAKSARSKASHKLPSPSALRCAPAEKLPPVVGPAPASERVKALRRVGEQLQEEADNALSLPLGCFLSPSGAHKPLAYCDVKEKVRMRVCE